MEYVVKCCVSVLELETTNCLYVENSSTDPPFNLTNAATAPLLKEFFTLLLSKGSGACCAHSAHPLGQIHSFQPPNRPSQKAP